MIHDDLRQLAEAASAVDKLTPDFNATVESLRRSGALGLAAAVGQAPDFALTSDIALQMALQSDPLAEIVRNAELFARLEHSFLEDIHFTEQLIADTDLARIISQAGSASLTTLLADMNAIGDLACRVAKSHPLVPEELGLISSLDPSQINTLVHQATTQLWEEVSRRGWTSTPPPSTSHDDNDVPPELPTEVQEVLAKAPPEQANAFERMWKWLGTQRAGTLSNIAVMKATAVSIAVTLLTAGAGATAYAIHTNVNASGTADGDVEVNAEEVQGDINIVNINLDVTTVLDSLNDDLEAQAALVQMLKKSRAVGPDGSDSDDWINEATAVVLCAADLTCDLREYLEQSASTVAGASEQFSSDSAVDIGDLACGELGLVAPKTDPSIDRSNVPINVFELLDFSVRYVDRREVPTSVRAQALAEPVWNSNTPILRIEIASKMPLDFQQLEECLDGLSHLKIVFPWRFDLKEVPSSPDAVFMACVHVGSGSVRSFGRLWEVHKCGVSVDVGYLDFVDPDAPSFEADRDADEFAHIPFCCDCLTFGVPR